MEPAEPTEAQLRVFAWGLPVVCLLLGAQRWLHGSVNLAYGLWSAGALLGALCGAAPRARRGLYRAWMRAARPLALGVSFAALAVVYFGVVTPTGLLLRALGRDPLARARSEGARSYWRARAAPRPRTSYFRQF
jgi:hypothetical protein